MTKAMINDHPNLTAQERKEKWGKKKSKCKMYTICLTFESKTMQNSTIPYITSTPSLNFSTSHRRKP